jgi:hypothetical protein
VRHRDGRHREPAGRGKRGHVELGNVRAEVACKLGNPAAGRFDYCGIVRQPIQLQARLNQLDMRQRRNARTLVIVRGGTEQRKQDLAPQGPERCGQIHRIVPNAADDIGGEKNPGRRLPH